MQCEKCEERMIRVNKMKSGNAEYSTYECQTCHTKKEECRGIVQ